MSDDCLITAWQLRDDCLMTAWLLPDDFLLIAWWLTNNCLTNVRKLPDKYQTTAKQLPNNYQTTTRQLPNNYQTFTYQATTSRLPPFVPICPHLPSPLDFQTFLRPCYQTTTRQLYQTTTRQLPGNFQTTTRQLLDNCLMTAWPQEIAYEVFPKIIRHFYQLKVDLLSIGEKTKNKIAGLWGWRSCAKSKKCL